MWPARLDLENHQMQLLWSHARRDSRKLDSKTFQGPPVPHSCAKLQIASEVEEIVHQALGNFCKVVSGNIWDGRYSKHCCCWENEWHKCAWKKGELFHKGGIWQKMNRLKMGEQVAAVRWVLVSLSFCFPWEGWQNHKTAQSWKKRQHKFCLNWLGRKLNSCGKRILCLQTNFSSTNEKFVCVWKGDYKTV